MKVMRFLGIWETMDMPCIKVRKNARVRWKKGNILRNLSVLAQRNDLQRWKDSVIWTPMDCRNCVLLYKENDWRICLFC
jgi:hypothetical protein